MNLTKTRATVDDLYRVEGKAEIVNDALVRFSMTGREPGYAGDMILFSMFQYVQRGGKGLPVGNGKGFVVDLPARQSFCPDAAFYVGPRSGMKFFDGAPVFAVEVRSEGDYGPATELGMAAKRADYFAAGTLVVWDVDLLDETAVVRVFRDGDSEHPAASYWRGDQAEAEPALPGWSMAVDDLFEPPEDQASNAFS
jgi:Uma2 family endonuclease